MSAALCLIAVGAVLVAAAVVVYVNMHTISY